MIGNDKSLNITKGLCSIEGCRHDKNKNKSNKPESISGN